MPIGNGNGSGIGIGVRMAPTIVKNQPPARIKNFFITSSRSTTDSSGERHVIATKAARPWKASESATNRTRARGLPQHDPPAGMLRATRNGSNYPYVKGADVK